MFSVNLKIIDKELNKYKTTPREELLNNCIKYKLSETLRRYNEEIDFNSDFLMTRSCTRVLKALTKIQKKQDKEILLDNIEELDLDTYADSSDIPYTEDEFDD